MNPATFEKDSQNPYKTGVLVGNHVEDRFGTELAASKKPYWEFTKSEAHDKFSPQEIERPQPPSGTEFEQFKTHLHPGSGQPHHLLFGHGPTQDHFEKRGFETTYDNFMERDRKPGPKKIPILINTVAEDIPTYGKTNALKDLKAKDYSEATKLFDQTWRKTGLGQS